MKRIKLLLSVLLISLLIPIGSFSQTTYTNIPDSLTVLNPTEIKTLNLILAEHSMWSEEVPLLNKEISALKESNSNYQKIDSLRVKEIDLYKEQHNNDIKSLDKLKKSINKWKIGTYSGIGASIALLIGFLIK